MQYLVLSDWEVSPELNDDVVQSQLSRAARRTDGSLALSSQRTAAGEDVDVVVGHDFRPLLFWLVVDGRLPPEVLRNESGAVLVTLMPANENGFIAAAVDRDVRPLSVVSTWRPQPPPLPDPYERGRDQDGQLLIKDVMASTGEVVRAVVERTGHPLLTWSETAFVMPGALRDDQGRILVAHLVVGQGLAEVPVDADRAPLAVPVAVVDDSELILLNKKRTYSPRPDASALS